MRQIGNIGGGLRAFPARRGRQEPQDLQQSAGVQERDAPEKGDPLLCAACSRPITRERERIRINERHEHVFANPHGYIYHIGCFAAAPGCLTVGAAESFFSWFPGYAWQVALCGGCGALLGWAYSSADAQFYGLILEKLAEPPK